MSVRVDASRARTLHARCMTGASTLTVAQAEEPVKEPRRVLKEPRRVMWSAVFLLMSPFHFSTLDVATPIASAMSLRLAISSTSDACGFHVSRRSRASKSSDGRGDLASNK